MKLTATQQKCIEDLKKKIDIARTSADFVEYVHRLLDYDIERINNNYDYYERIFKPEYEATRNCIVLTSYGKPTLYALEKRGIISILKLGHYRSQHVIDAVKLNNY